MTTFLLHGGKTSSSNENNQHFFDSFTTVVDKSQVHILLCYFARPVGEWNELTTRDSNLIKKNSTKSVFITVPQNPTELLAQLDEADVLYVAGGGAPPIETLYPQLGELKTKLDQKIYAGSSMGAFLASQNYVLSFDDQDNQTVHQGVGLLPLQVLCHWDVEPEKQRKLQLLRDKSNLPILTLNETEFVEIHA